MTIWKVIQRFNFKQSWQLLLFSLKYPLYVYPTLKATSKSFLRAKKEFPKTHGGKGKANAYRHAYWNALICFECNKWSKNKRRILAWAKLITNKHELLSPNEPLDKKMDLHNNLIGRNLFITSDFKNEAQISERIKMKLTSAQKITSLEDVELHPIELVYISHK